MRELFIDDLAKSASLARVADTTHARQSVSPNLPDLRTARRGIRISLTFSQMPL